MKKQHLILAASLFSIFLYSCGNGAKINTKEEAVKFLESHTWRGKNVTYRLHGKETTNDSWNGDLKFSNNTVIYADEWSNYTIARDEDGDKNWYFILTFSNGKMSPFSHGIETFKLYKDGTAHCYPSGDGDNDGVFADYDFPEERTPDPITNAGNRNNTAQAPVLNINDMNACLNYLKGRTFNSPLNRIIISTDYGVTVYRLRTNEQTFSGKINLGTVVDNSNRILEVFAPNGNNTGRFFLYPDGTLQGSDASGMKFKPVPNHQDSVPSQPQATGTEPPTKQAIIDSTGGQIQKGAFGSAEAISDHAYFYRENDVKTKTKSYMVKGEKANYTRDTGGNFIYVEFTNPQGVVTKGWMLKSDFQIVPEQAD